MEVRILRSRILRVRVRGAHRHREGHNDDPVVDGERHDGEDGRGHRDVEDDLGGRRGDATPSGQSERSERGQSERSERSATRREKHENKRSRQSERSERSAARSGEVRALRFKPRARAGSSDPGTFGSSVEARAKGKSRFERGGSQHVEANGEAHRDEQPRVGPRRHLLTHVARRNTSTSK